MDNILASILQFTDGGLTVAENQTSVHSYEPSSGLAILCFSKDRPFQLHQLLLSIECCFEEYPQNVVVLYCPGTYSEEYAVVFGRHQRVTPLLETNFESNFVSAIRLLQLEAEHVMFCVDDLIFTRRFSFRTLATTLNHDSTLFAMHVKLHPGIVYSHAGSKVCIPSKLYGAWVNSSSSSAPSQQLYLTFYLAQGVSEWRYPFDLCASIYRISDILSLIKLAAANESSGSNGLSNPNKLEFTGNKLFWSCPELHGKYFKCACSSVPLASVITVNKVQTTYDVPIYQNRFGDVDSLNRLVHCTVASVVSSAETACEVVYDTLQYGLLNSISVHIGDMLLTSSLSVAAVPRPMSACQVSVIIPVYNGAVFLAQCMSSLIDTTQGCAFEIVLIDDGSTDNSVSIAEEWKTRAENSENNRVCMVIHRLAHQGLNAALDHGILHTSCPFIARMDADDICEPHRLSRQLDYLLSHPTIHVLGGQALLFSGSEPSGTGTAAYLAHNMPTQSLLIQWEMLFRCAVIHPTVMMRRATVLECGGYSCHNPVSTTNVTESSYMTYVEDYWLWCRVMQRYPLSIAALPDVVLNLRRHSGSKSRQEAQHSKATTMELQLHWISQVLGTCDREYAAAMFEPTVALTSEAVSHGAIELLKSLRVWCLGLLDTVPVSDNSDEILRVRDDKSLEEVSIPRSTKATDDDSGSAIRAVLEHYFKTRHEKILINAAKKFPRSDFGLLLSSVVDSSSSISIDILKALVSS